MGLYLCVFANDDEVEGVEVGGYDDFGRFREAVTTHVEGGDLGSRCPVLNLHSDCEGEWSVAECARLKKELSVIADTFKRLPPTPLQPGSWQDRVAKTMGIRPSSLYDCFFDVDGESLVERIDGLCDASARTGSSILFQ